MEVTVSDAKAVLTDLVRRAEAGDSVVLTRRGRPVAKIVAVDDAPSVAARRASAAAILAEAAARRASRGMAVDVDVEAELYDADGLPR